MFVCVISRSSSISFVSFQSLLESIKMLQVNKENFPIKNPKGKINKTSCQQLDNQEVVP